MNTPLTSQEYAEDLSKATGNDFTCPLCGYRYSSGGNPGVDNPFVTKENGTLYIWMNCHVCEATWYETYKLTGYTELKDKKT